MPTERRPDIDWLRVLATYLLFVFHVGKVFDPVPFYHIRNADLSFGMTIFCGFVHLWHMPLFFLLAGWSAVASLEMRGTRVFVRERVRRLFVPLVAGCILLAPVLKYLELRSGLDVAATGLRVAPALQQGFRTVIPRGVETAPPFDESFWTFLPTFFTQLQRFSWSHLWFIAYLFTFTLVYLPLIVWCVRRRATWRSAGTWLVYLPILPLALVQLALRPRWPGLQNLYDDWANVAYYSTYLLAGVVIACQPALERRLDGEWRRALVVALGTTLVLLAALLGGLRSQAVPLVGSAVAGWCFVVAFLGLGRAFLTRTGPALDYLVESAFPIYVLHQSAIVLPGFLIVGLPLGIAAKFVLLLAVSVGLALATYHWLVRPFAVPRVLLGMKPPARSPRPTAAPMMTAAT
jgi:peptidoglycan/LPS O-acetylase OafA/YrhL